MARTYKAPLFQHRHYAVIAALLAHARDSVPAGYDGAGRADMLAMLTHLLDAKFRDDNPNYDAERFRAAASGKPLTRKDAR